MNIAIICGYPIPYGMAATTRINAYSKGLVEEGAKVDVWSFIPTGDKYNEELSDSVTIDNIHYQYSFRRKKFSNKIAHAIEIIFSIFSLLVKIHCRRKQYDSIIVSTDNPFILSAISIATRKKCPLFFIFDEYPTPIRKKLKEKIPHWKCRFYKYALKNYSGYISMTEKLLQFYQAICEHPGVIISNIIDTTRFPANLQTAKEKTLNTVNISYVGNMELTKDNVDNIIIALSKAKNKDRCHLFLFGVPTQQDKLFLQKTIEKNELQKQVSFNFIPSQHIPRALQEADILVSSQPDTKRAEGGFPTKLGEYLASGKPTLLTDVGEISKQFTHKKHLFFAKPNNPIDYAEKIDFIIDHYEYALEIAQFGKQYISENFSHRKAGKEIINFINNITTCQYLKTKSC